MLVYVISGQFDTVDNLTPRTIRHRGQFDLSISILNISIFFRKKQTTVAININLLMMMIKILILTHGPCCATCAVAT